MASINAGTDPTPVFVMLGLQCLLIYEPVLAQGSVSVIHDPLLAEDVVTHDLLLGQGLGALPSGPFRECWH